MKKIVFLAVLILSVTLLSACASKTWTLFVCESPHPNGGCFENKYVLRGYQSQKECMEKGISLMNQSGFECGYGCREEDGWGTVCKEICNEKGCN